MPFHYRVPIPSTTLLFILFQGLPDDSVAMLSFSLANRSACLYRMKMYQEAINDIQIALSLNYPRGL